LPIRLSEVVAPAHTAVLTMEMQRGVIGDLAALPQLATEAADLGVVTQAARLLQAARACGAPVVHCLFHSEEGGPLNAPLLTAMARLPTRLIAGSPAAELVHELGEQPSDVKVSRSHGVSPFGGTSLDSDLRRLGISTVVVAGVSVNLGVLGLAIEAVNLGYHVVVATDAVCGLPRDYAENVMRNSVALVATRATVEDVITAWG
jgi:nicotinamidase-related amidase